MKGKSVVNSGFTALIFFAVPSSLQGAAHVVSPKQAIAIYEVSKNHHPRNHGFYIEIWNGDKLQTGHLGAVQNDFNLLGHVYCNAKVSSLTYSLNGAVPKTLNILAFRRIARDNDFNADIPVTELNPGENSIILKAFDIHHDSAVRKLTIIRKTGGSYRLPVSIQWSRVKNPEDVGESSDGRWILSNEGLRTQEVGYDRVFLIGDKSWKDYVVKARVTFNDTSRKNGPQSSLARSAGFCLRWSGHSSDENNPGDQPKWGLHPRGAIVWLTLYKGELPALMEYLRGDSEYSQRFVAPIQVRFGKPFWMKAKCQTLPDSAGQGATKYSFKIWNTNEKEPQHWNFEITQTSASALRSGAVALVAHELDVTFGDINIDKLP